MAHGKRFRQQYGKVQRDHAYPPAEAVSLIKETASANFDETVELHLLLGLNVRHAEEQLRGTLALPHGLGKDVTVAVFAQGQQARDAESAGADFVGGRRPRRQSRGGLDRLRRRDRDPADDGHRRQTRPRPRAAGQDAEPEGRAPSPTMSRKLSRPRNPGKVEYRTDRQAIVHMTIGKASFDNEKLLDNYTAVIDEIVRAKPAGAKGKYIRLGDPDGDDGPRHQSRLRQGRRQRSCRSRRQSRGARGGARDCRGAGDRLDCVAAQPQTTGGVRAEARCR